MAKAQARYGHRRPIGAPIWRGAIVITNHSGSARHVLVAAKEVLRNVRQVSASGITPLEIRNNSFRIQVEAFAGAVAEYREAQ